MLPPGASPLTGPRFIPVSGNTWGASGASRVLVTTVAATYGSLDRLTAYGRGPSIIDRAAVAVVPPIFVSGMGHPAQNMVDAVAGRVDEDTAVCRDPVNDFHYPVIAAVGD